MRDQNSNLKRGIIKFLTIAGDLMALEALWFVCSLPIITIGPATSALFDITLRIANDEPVTVLKGFFMAFKKNFKQALIVGVFSIFVLVTLYADVMYILAIEGTLQKIYIVIAILVFAMLLIIVTYGNGLLARYNNTLKGHIINAFKLAFVNPVQTILMWLVILAPVFMFLFIPPIVLVYIGWFIILFAVSLPVYICSNILIQIFKRFESREVDRK